MDNKEIIDKFQQDFWASDYCDCEGCASAIYPNQKGVDVDDMEEALNLARTESAKQAQIKAFKEVHNGLKKESEDLVQWINNFEKGGIVAEKTREHLSGIVFCINYIDNLITQVENA